jgi:alpha-beta hydrolase superfamily lysophospholipase
VETDVLGEPYERRTIELASDDEGELVATLVRLRAAGPTTRAVLYVHGFVDYFFQTHVAEFYTARGYDFYALDLHKYGRSLRDHHTPNFALEMSDYFTEIDEAVRIIREEEGHDTLLINAHSTGGLITALWADRVRGRGLVQGLFLNSPFFEFNSPWLVRHTLNPIVATLGKRRPKSSLPQELSKTYGRSLHRDYDGEWDYDLGWKPLQGYAIYAGWVRAISRGHRQLQRGLKIDVPVLVGASTKSYRGQFAEAAHHADAVLDVDHIVKYAPGLGQDVTVLRIEGGKHDLALSPAAAREQLFTALDTWLRSTPGLGVDTTLGVD